ncbi:MAG TPA: hypothetical protein VG125_31670 [Pirellulales bacterium]|nr:hypothetical protein [Pirellulales bacterium]
MNVDLGALSIAAVGIGFVHTLFGPDHYVPFVAMSRVGGWSFRKTLVVTLLCGLAHVGSSVLLGLVGVALGLILQMETIEEQRGNVAGWLLIGFGLAYCVWGLLHALRNRSHTHLHSHADGTIHAHEHTHFGGHLHPHGERAPAEEAAAAGCGAPAATKADLSPSITPWVLFAIFAFGPCEPLIPLLIYPAAKADMWSVACVTSLFALTTLATMTSMVFLVSAGTSVLRFDRLARYSHALAGLVLLSCGLAVKAGL